MEWLFAPIQKPPLTTLTTILECIISLLPYKVVAYVYVG